MISSFSKEVKERINHYVYRLVDPRNGQTFYVGEGCGDRVFHHVNAVDMSFYDKHDYSNPSDKPTPDNPDPAKIKRILEIRSKGLNVIHMIQRWGMDKETAFEVEAAFIDYFGLGELTNRVKGHNSNRGMRYADELEREFNAEVFEENETTPKFILIKIKDYWINRNGGFNCEGIYKTVRGNWKINPDKANKYPYVLAVRYGIVVGVYKINENGWKRCSDSNRSYFDGEEASNEIKKLFIDKKIPDHYVKRQNPAGYCKF